MASSNKRPVSPRFLVKSTIKHLLADTSKVCILWQSAVYGGEDDDYQFTGETRQNWEETTVSEFTRKYLNIVIRHLIPDDCDQKTFKSLFGWHYNEIPSSERQQKFDSLPDGWEEKYMLADPQELTFDHIVSEYCEFGEGLGWIAILTRKDCERFKSNQWAIKMNDKAQSFCTKHKVEFATIPFFNAISKEIRMAKRNRDDFFGGEQSAERYATYRACGSGSYWEDNDYMSSRLNQPIQELQELLRFCQLKLPCQYALWKESRMKK